MSSEPVISADGRWIAFTSNADDLVPEIDEHTGARIADTNGMVDIFVYDRHGGQIRRADLSSDGEQSNNNSGSPAISADGRWVAYWSAADNLVPGANRGVYLYDRSTGTTRWVADGLAPTISPDGRWGLSGSNDKTLRLWEFDWEYEFRDPKNWDKGARFYLKVFLSLHTPCGPNGISRVGTPIWTEEDFQQLLTELGYCGYGWLRPEGVQRELERMARDG